MKNVYELQREINVATIAASNQASTVEYLRVQESIGAVSMDVLKEAVALKYVLKAHVESIRQEMAAI